MVHGGDQGFRGYGLDVVGDCNLEQKRRRCYRFAISQTHSDSYSCLDQDLGLAQFGMDHMVEAVLMDPCAMHVRIHGLDHNGV